MKRIHLFILVGLMGLSFYLGYRLGDTRSAVVEDPHVIKELVASNKVLAKQRLWDEDQIHVLKLSLKQDSLKFLALEKNTKALEWKMNLQQQEFKKQIEEIRGSTLAKLDSFRWARYPDSLTVVKRQQQLQYENY